VPAAGSGVSHFKDRVLDFDQVEMRFVPLVVKQPQALAIRNRDEGAVIQDHVFLRGRISRALRRRPIISLPLLDR